MKRWHWLATGASAYLAMLIVLAPAALLDAILALKSDGRIRLAEPRGSVWSGAGRIQVLDKNRQIGVGKDIAWRWLPRELLLGRLACEIELDSSARPFYVAAARGRIEVTGADLRVPAAVLGIVEPRLAAFGLGGELDLHIADLVIADADVQATASIVWRAATSAHTKVSPLGDYELRIEHAGLARSARLRTLAGPLQLDGLGEWARGSRPSLAATARVSPQRRDQLDPFLRMIAVERGAGNYEFQLR
jgi:general secretion pathway protein N